jgi:uncharacterized protein (TIGR02246 family)
MSAQASTAQESNDEQAIRELVDTWLTATRKQDLDNVLRLMADDIVFMVPGKEPFGKEEFAANSRQMKDTQIEAISEIKEIKVLDDWAWMRNYLEVTFTAPGGEATVRSGYVLSILRKNPDGSWVIARDANLLTPQTTQSTN